MHLSLPSAAARDGVIYIILDGRAVFIPSTDIIYLSDIANMIFRTFCHHLVATIDKNAMGNMSSSSPLHEGGSTQPIE
jgi:hypothetical protein